MGKPRTQAQGGIGRDVVKGRRQEFLSFQGGVAICQRGVCSASSQAT